MRKIVRKTGLLLCSVMLFGCFAACADDEKEDPSGKTEVWTPAELTSNGEEIAEYQIVVAADAGESILYAADRLQYNLEQSISVKLPIVKDTVSEKTLEILVGQTNRNEDDDVDFSALGKESYVVKTVGKDLVIAGNERGAIYGTYAFLEALGFRYYTSECTFYPKSKEIFVPTELNLTWQPTFEYRESFYFCALDEEWAVSQAINGAFWRDGFKTDKKYGGYMGYVGGDSWMYHTAQKLLPAVTYLAQHPEYFSESGEDPCWSNEEAMNIMYNNMLAKIDSDSSSTIFALSMNDISEAQSCHCDTCSAQRAEYGDSGWYFRRINWFAQKLKQDRPGIKIEAIAYTYAKEPPENLVMEDNVIIKYCASALCRWHSDPAECDELQKHIDNLRTWKQIASEVTVYSYSINWHMLYTRDGDLDVMRTNVRLYAENGATGIYNEGCPKESAEFHELKSYLHAKLLKNPWMSKEEYRYHIEDFMEGYYGDAGEYLLQYIDESTELTLNMQKTSGKHLAFNYGVEDNFPIEYDFATHSYDMTFFDRFNDLFDQAEDAVTGEEYERVRKSRIHLTYIEFYNTFDNRLEYADDEEYEELIERNEALYNDIKKYGCYQRHDRDSSLKNVTIDDFTLCCSLWWR